MPITDKQREQRRQHLGSSDMAAVMGLSPWKTPYDVWVEKTGREDPTLMRDDTTPAMRSGNLLEPAILDFAEEELGSKITRNQYRSRPDLHIGCNVDGIVFEGEHAGDPVEAKSSGIDCVLNFEEWGEEGTDAVPVVAIVQDHTHMLATNALVCHTPALIPPRGFQMFRVDQNAEVSAQIAETANLFWTRYVVTDTPPPSEASVAVIKTVKRVAGKRVMLSKALHDQWREMREKAALAKKALERIETKLKQELGDAEEATFQGIEQGITYYAQDRKAYHAKASRFRKLNYKEKGFRT